MKTKLMMAALAAMIAGPAVLPAPALAQNDGYYDHNHVYHRYHEHSYHGRDDRYRHHCGSGNGAVGTIAGGVGGGLLGNALGGGTLGTIAGAGGGALLGRHFDKKHTEHENRDKYGC